MIDCDRCHAFDAYFVNIARSVERGAKCLGRSVGAVIALDNRIVSTGYNGTPQGMKNCTEGGCRRCERREEFKPGEGYDKCICVHAEQNAMLAAARFGIAIEGGCLYSTLQPCFTCLKEAVQAGIRRIVYVRDLAPAPAHAEDYANMAEILVGKLWKFNEPPPVISLSRDAAPPGRVSSCSDIPVSDSGS